MQITDQNVKESVTFDMSGYYPLVSDSHTEYLLHISTYHSNNQMKNLFILFVPIFK